MKYILTIILLASLFSCKKEDFAFNFEFLSESEKNCFRENFITKNIDHLSIKKQLIDGKAKCYVQGRLVNKKEGIDHDFMIGEGIDSNKVTMWQAFQYVSTAPDIDPESKPISTYTEMVLGGGSKADKFGFNASVIFTPQEVGDFNQSFDKFFRANKLAMYDAKWCCNDGLTNNALKKGFEISFYIGCLSAHPTFPGEKTISHQFWLPADPSSDRQGNILSYERIDNRDYYTYKVKVDISGKLYAYGRDVADDTYFAEIQNGVLFMVFDQKK